MHKGTIFYEGSLLHEGSTTANSKWINNYYNRLGKAKIVKCNSQNFSTASSFDKIYTKPKTQIFRSRVDFSRKRK